MQLRLHSQYQYWVKLSLMETVSFFNLHMISSLSELRVCLVQDFVENMKTLNISNFVWSGHVKDIHHLIKFDALSTVTQCGMVFEAASRAASLSYPWGATLLHHTQHVDLSLELLS